MSNTSTQSSSFNSPQPVSYPQHKDILDVYTDHILLQGFEFHDLEFVEKFAPLSYEDRRKEFLRIVDVGKICLQRASAAIDVDFIKGQIGRLLNDVESKVGIIPSAIHTELLKSVGTADGQVLKPLLDAMQQVTLSLSERIFECRSFVTTVLDPAHVNSSAGRMIRSLHDLLDPARQDSVQGRLTQAVNRVIGLDGGLATTVKMVLTDTIRPLREELDSLAKEIRGQGAAQEAVMNTTQRGISYEQEIVDSLGPWVRMTASAMQHVGPDNRPGDIVLSQSGNSISGLEMRTVLEVRDRQSAVGRRALSDIMAGCMEERSANAGLYLSRSSTGLAQEVGDWAEGEAERGPWVATTHEFLFVALRFLILSYRSGQRQSELPALDRTMLENQFQRIRTALGRLGTVNRKVTLIRSSAEEISEEATVLRDEVREGMGIIEQSIQQAAVNS